MATTDQPDEWAQADGSAVTPVTRVLLYSDNVQTRDAVMVAVGRRAAKDLPEVEWVQVATHDAVIAAVDEGGLDLLVLDGEAGKSGGMGLCRQIKDEIFRAPPVLVLTGRPEDAWLASWAEADAVVSRPLDPLALQSAVATLLRAPTTA